MIFKIIILIAILYLIYIIFFKNESSKKEKSFKPKNPFKRKEKKEETEIMVECEKCGIFLSSKEAIIKDGKYYCSKECAGVKK
jgi:uncharacterized protein